MESPLRSFDLSGRVAVVTGGSRGLGEAMVRGFAACGADVVIASRKAQACEKLAGEVRADLFWGTGAEAGELAGNMKQQGQIWLLWPKGIPLPAVAAPTQGPGSKS